MSTVKQDSFHFGMYVQMCVLYVDFYVCLNYVLVSINKENGCLQCRVLFFIGYLLEDFSFSIGLCVVWFI